MALKTDYKDYIPSTALQKFQMVQNSDGTVSFQDVTDYSQVGDKAQASVFNGIGTEVNAHTGDTTAHVTQAEHDKIDSAVQSATLGGAAVTKSGQTLQLPAYPTALPANGGTAAYAHYSSHAVASSGAALRNNTATVGGSPSGGSDGDGWDICT